MSVMPEQDERIAAGDAAWNGGALRANDAIRAPSVLLIEPDGAAVGVLPLPEALARARAAGCDLVEVNPRATPPVCRLMEPGRAETHARKRPHVSPPAEVRALRFRSGVSETDIRLKARHGRAFLADGGAVELRIEIGSGDEHGAGDAAQAAHGLLERLRDELSSVGTCSMPPTRQQGELLALLLPRAGTEPG